MGINANRAFHNQSTDDNYLSQLTVDDDEKKELRHVRDTLRAALIDGFANVTQIVERRELFEAAALQTFAADAAPTLRPKFRMQGSWSYDTLNCTTHEPPQEIDLDDGMFLPISFLAQDGSTHPAIVSRAYFVAVERILKPVCDKHGWTLDRSKSSCVRVKVRTGAHIDIALYAIPDNDFTELVEKADAASFRSFAAFDELPAYEELYATLPDDHIMLAHREEGWKPSDPRKLEDWFRAAIGRHGYQLRRVCRYLKAWRDFRWPGCRLSSIALMACAVTAFDEAHGQFDNARDDKALLIVADRLPTLLSGAIANPVVDGQRLDEQWGDGRADFVAQARTLGDTLRSVLASSNRGAAVAGLVALLGGYMPADIDYLSLEGLDGAPTILKLGLVKELGDEPEARESVKVGGDERYG